jgi:sugar lactone lactonase YvrE
MRQELALCIFVNLWYNLCMLFSPTVTAALPAVPCLDKKGDPSMYEVEHVVTAQNEVGESPRWDAQSQTLYWADIGPRPQVFSYRPATGEHHSYPIGLPITGWAQRAAGGFILATKVGLWFWNPETNLGQFIVDPEADNPAVRFNDALADRQGRFWAGSTNDVQMDTRDGSLYRLDPDGSLHTMDHDLARANGIGWSPDNKTLYVTAQFAYETYAWDFDPATGDIANRRVFARVTPQDGLPDGLTVDSEGGVWSALWGGWRLLRYDPDGKVERELRLPVPNPTAAMFGGPDLDELYITTAWYLLDESERRAAPHSGDLFRARLGIRGLPEPKFLG